eukprot:g369.t1
MVNRRSSTPLFSFLFFLTISNSHSGFFGNSNDEDVQGAKVDSSGGTDGEEYSINDGENNATDGDGGEYATNADWLEYEKISLEKERELAKILQNNLPLPFPGAGVFTKTFYDLAKTHLIPLSTIEKEAMEALPPKRTSMDMAHHATKLINGIPKYACSSEHASRILEKGLILHQMRPDSIAEIVSQARENAFRALEVSNDSSINTMEQEDDIGYEEKIELTRVKLFLKSHAGPENMRCPAYDQEARIQFYLNEKIAQFDRATEKLEPVPGQEHLFDDYSVWFDWSLDNSNLTSCEDVVESICQETKLNAIATSTFSESTSTELSKYMINIGIAAKKKQNEIPSMKVAKLNCQPEEQNNWTENLDGLGSCRGLKQTEVGGEQVSARMKLHDIYKCCGIDATTVESPIG